MVNQLPINHYQGLTADTKPTINVDIGATYTEIDGFLRTWEWNGASWVLEVMSVAMFDPITGNPSFGPFTFQNAITTTGQGNTLTVGLSKNLSINIYGTAKSRTVNFYTINANNELIPLQGYNISTGTLATSTSGTSSETWQFDITGLNKIVISVTAISGGNLTVIGTVVN